MNRAAVAMAVTAMVTNYDHLLSLGVWKMANALWNYFSDINPTHVGMNRLSTPGMPLSISSTPRTWG